MRTLTVLACGALCVLLLSPSARAAEWPGNFLGQPDNAYRVLRIGVFYYAAVLHDIADEQGVQPLPGGADWLAQLAALPELSPEAMQAEQARIAGELNEAARFYWRNSRFNCALDYTWINDFTPRLRSTIAAADAPYYGPQCPPLYTDAMKKYDGLCQIMVLYSYDKTTGALKRVRGGGGFTNGCDPAQRTCGWSWWAACSADNVCGNDWLLVHEFGHQLDSLFDASGHPEFWFNHLALSEGNVARFGEHFDANAYILRRAPEADWLDLKWGDLRHYADADGDGVPAVEPWLTQRGLNTDPADHAADADGDGLGDFAEYMASNGNRNGHGDRLYPALAPCDPLDTDSDHDGTADGADPLPMFPGGEYIPHRVVNGPFVPNYIAFTNQPQGLDFAVELAYVADKWDDAAGRDVPGRLELALYWGQADAAPVEREVKLMLDLQHNGWFAGDDNYRIALNADGVTSVRQTLAASATEWPRDDDTTIDKTTFGFEKIAAPAPYASGVKLTLTKAMLKELALKPGAEIGLNLGLRNSAEPWFYMLGDPNSLMLFELR
jgi:hypothetical protein